MNKRQCGFTLIELLTVVLVIGLLAGVAALAVFDDSPERELRRAAERLQQVIELAAEEAMFQGETLALELREDPISEQLSYQWLIQNEQREWVTIDDESTVYNGQDFPELARGQLILDTGLPAELRDPKQPQLYFYGSGEITPFTLQLFDAEQRYEVSLQADLMARITIELESGHE